MKSRHSTSAISAIPMGAPGWPEFAAWTASIASTRITLASSLFVGILDPVPVTLGRLKAACNGGVIVHEASAWGNQHFVHWDSCEA